MTTENSIAYHIGLLSSALTAVENLGEQGLRIYEVYNWKAVAGIIDEVLQYMSKLEAARVSNLLVEEEER